MNFSRCRLGLLGYLLLTGGLAAAAQWAQTPPMGWNSWDAYGTTVTESEVQANADYLASRLKAVGWEYIIVDIQWSDPTPKSHGYRKDADLVMDANGRLIPAPGRFPSSASGKGFTELAQYVHNKGLKFGIHIMRGIPKRAVEQNLPILGTQSKASDIADKTSLCKWNGDMYGVDLSKPGGQAYYDSIVSLYAGWGVDYIKADDMAIPFHGAEISALHKAIVKSGRPIVLSLSPGPADLSKAAFYAENANLWRISNDFWDRWPLLKKNFDLLNAWASYAKPGAWPDADMLPLGRIGLRAEVGDDRKTNFTPDEQRTLMTLWCIARSPLMFGGDLPSNDAFTLSLINNKDVIDVDQHGQDSHRLFADGDKVAWVSDVPGGKGRYLAIFNTGDTAPVDISIQWRQLGLKSGAKLRDLWERKDLSSSGDGHTFTLKPHASGLYRIQE
jgi:alpha-galactosidase